MALELTRSYQKQIVIELEAEPDDEIADSVSFLVEKVPSGRQFIFTVQIRDVSGLLKSSPFLIAYDLQTAQFSVTGNGSSAQIQNGDRIIVSGFLS